MKRPFLISLTVLLLALPLAMGLPVSACSPSVWRDSSPVERAAAAEVVLVGTVIGADQPNTYEANYAIQVESYLKQTGAEIVLVTGYSAGGGGGDCLNAIVPNEKYIFYLLGDPQKDAVLRASYLYVYAAIDVATPQDVAAISAATGQDPITPTHVPLGTQVRYWTYSTMFRLLVILGTPALILSIVLALGTVYQRNKKSKRKNDE